MLALVSSIRANETVTSSSAAGTAACNADESFGRQPIYFIENQGQLSEEAAYYVKGSKKTLYFTSEGITFALAGLEGDETCRWAMKLAFENAGSVKPEGADKQEAVFSYFKGKPEDWHTGIPTYSKIIYENLWPGIDLVYSGTVNELKYEFVVKPGADPDQIRLVYQGASDVSVQESGALKVKTPAGDFEDGKPYAFQMKEGKPKEVSMHYGCVEKRSDGSFVYGFDLGAFDPAKLLILDPVLFVYCGYIGSPNHDYSDDIAVDSEGCAYLTGTVFYPGGGFPVHVGPDLTFNGGLSDAFVAKVNAQGTALIYCGFIGGDFPDHGTGIAVDGKGCAYVSGLTKSDEDSFPVHVGPDLTYNGEEDFDAFVAKVNAQGRALDYCGYIGGNKDDLETYITVDDEGCAYVTGETASHEDSFPVGVGPDLLFNGGLYDAFVAKVNAQGADLDYCGFIGGGLCEYGSGIAVDDEGCAYVTGLTYSDESTFPVTVGPDLTFNSYLSDDAYVAKVNAQGTALVYCGYIGGYDREYYPNIDVDDEGCAYVAGGTSSDESTFPVLIGPDLTFNSFMDAFVSKVNAQGTGLVYCGYIGGMYDDVVRGVAVDEAGCAYVSGRTDSDETSFPVLVGPDLTFNSPFGWGDGFVAKVNGQGTGLIYCGYIGGEGFDDGFAIAVDDAGCAYVAGWTESDETTFPVLVGPDLTHNGKQDAIVAKIAMALAPDGHTLSAATGGTIDFELYTGQDNAGRNYLLLGSVSGTDPGYPLPGGLATLPLNLDAFTDVVLLLLNTSVFHDFLGTTDTYGQADAQLNAPPLDPIHIGVIMHYAFCLNAYFDFVSNPVQIEVVP
jgi:hypothetical protein